MNDNFTMGITALVVAASIISMLPPALMQEDNAANNTADNTMPKNITILNKTDSAAAGNNQSASLSAYLSVLHIGKGLNGGPIGITGISKSNIGSPIKSISYHSSMPEMALGSPAKPMKDLERVVFVCNIL